MPPSTIFSCVLKSQDGGQTFYDVQLNDYIHLGEKLPSDGKCVKINRIPNSPIIDVWAEKAADKTVTSEYMRLHGRYSQYNGLKPRWLTVNLYAHHIWSNFTVNRDIFLAHIINERSRDSENVECFMLVDSSMGGYYVDYNLLPITKIVCSDLVSNWCWWKRVEFIMKVWLLAQSGNGIVVYQILVDYDDSEFPDHPTHVTYSLRFVCENEDLKSFLKVCFNQLKIFSIYQPETCLDYYTSAVENLYMQKTSEKLIRVTWERLHIEEKKDEEIIGSASSQLTLGSPQSFKSQVVAKWVIAIKITKEVEQRVIESFKRGDNSESDDRIGDRSGESPNASVSHVAKEMLERDFESIRNVIVSGGDFSEENLKSQAQTFLLNLLELNIRFENVYHLGKDKRGHDIICIRFENVADKNLVLMQNSKLRRIGSKIYINEYLSKEERKNRATKSPKKY